MVLRAGVVGLGLMGGSLLRRLTVADAGSTRASGWDCDAHTRMRAATAGLPVAGSLEELAAISDVLFVAVPLDDLTTVFTAVSGLGDPPAIISDLTSVKGPVRDLAAAYEFAFVGGHPMAGTERSGFAASTADLLADAAWVLTLDPETDLAAWLEVARVITALGCRVVPCTSAEHDRAVARVSHLPHLVAAALVLGAAQDPLALALAAGSFRDATRVATTRPELIAAMCGGNADALATELAAFAAALEQAGPQLREPEELTGWFAAAGRVRSRWPALADVRAELAIDPQLAGHLLAKGRAGGQVTEVTDVSVVIWVPTTLRE